MTDHADQNAGPRPPSLLDALLPVVVLIALIALTIALFGISATDGPLQVALLLSAAFASLIALKNGYTSAAIADAAIGGVTTAMSAIFILLAVGALIGTWNMAGTIPTVVDYGVRLLNPTIFYLTTAAICAVVGMVTGSSWTTAGTLGVAFVGMSKVMGLSEATAAGAVICGAYFGDKMTPLSETTILAPTRLGPGPRAAAHRPGSHDRPAHQKHVLDGRAGARDQSRHLSCRRIYRDARGGRKHRRRARRPGARVQYHSPQPAPARASRRLHAQEGPTVSGDPRPRAVRGHPRLLPAVERGEGVRGRAESQ